MEKFQKLKVLNLDSNIIEDDNKFPRIETLETLWLNSNKVSHQTIILLSTTKLFKFIFNFYLQLSFSLYSMFTFLDIALNLFIDSNRICLS